MLIKLVLALSDWIIIDRKSQHGFDPFYNYKIFHVEKQTQLQNHIKNIRSFDESMWHIRVIIWYICKYSAHLLYRIARSATRKVF